MKHLKPIVRNTPKPATALEDALCGIIILVDNILGAFSGSSPLAGYLADKCSFEVPEA